MKKSIALAMFAALALVPSTAFGESLDKATGGGQVVFSSDGKGAGNTIAFTAQSVEEGTTAAKGQVQHIDRSAGKGRDQVKFHGIVECILVVGNVAEVAGRERDSGGPFTLRAVDGGEGREAADEVFFDDVADDKRCEADDNDDEDTLVALARGNVQVRDGDLTNNGDQRSSSNVFGFNTSTLKAASGARLSTMSWKAALRLAGMKTWRR